MSTGVRIPLSRAQAAARYLIELWQLEGAHVVGSVRRQRSEVGDLELIVPAMAAIETTDQVYAAIERTMVAPSVNSLFDAPREKPIGRALRGLNRGFLACALIVTMKDGTALPVQVYRYTPDNFGWMMLMRTGPADYGKWFLGKWKDRHRIDHERQQASINGHLVDAAGRIIPTPSEEEAFALCGIKYQPPERRDEFIARVQAGAR